HGRARAAATALGLARRPVRSRVPLASPEPGAFLGGAPTPARGGTPVQSMHRPDAPDVSADEADQKIDQKLGVWRFDALGIDPELVARLETLFRMELDPLRQQPKPPPPDNRPPLTRRPRPRPRAGQRPGAR